MHDKQHDSFEALYLRERRKTAIFIATTIIMALLAVGAFAYNFNQTDRPTPVTGSNPSDGPVMRGGGSGGGVIMPADDILDYLKSDGTVDQAAIEDEASRRQGPPAMMEAMYDAREKQIDEALDADDITSQQADELKEAWREATGI